MSFDWTSYISLAEALNSGSPSEAQMRSATSRAYYGAFISCRNAKGMSMQKDADVHRQLIYVLKESDDVIEVSLGNMLHDLRIKRNSADYDGFFAPTIQSTKLDIDKAKTILNLLEDM